ncbi:hypothetical protein AW736_01940 [Termitidicoccus mucosus]|uniref:Thioredoxin domain-containing protein n=2 Tax=Termitidicoccus mucosus TaxID=1184151 RepID=A0A178IPL6_9BACT|nr:hypothetical protein AW736_01940 [Opitutaceae bacterium TSB47]
MTASKPVILLGIFGSVVILGLFLALFLGRTGDFDEEGLMVERGAKEAEAAHIAHGEAINIEDYVASGRVTIFDFTSPYCPPCRYIGPHLDSLHRDDDGVVVVKVEINRPGVHGIDFSSPVAQKYKLPHVPYFIVYPPNGGKPLHGDKARKFVEKRLSPYFNITE